MNAASFFMLLVYVAGMSAGQMLFKKAAERIAAKSGLDQMLLLLVTDWHFLAALVIYAALTLYWVWLLSFIPLAKAYPFVALSIAATVVMGWQFFGEKLQTSEIIGCLFIVGGVAMMAWRSH